MFCEKRSMRMEFGCSVSFRVARQQRDHIASASPIERKASDVDEVRYATKFPAPLGQKFSPATLEKCDTARIGLGRPIDKGLSIIGAQSGQCP